MDEHVVKSFQKYWILKDLRENYTIKDGYFYLAPFLSRISIAKSASLPGGLRLCGRTARRQGRQAAAVAGLVSYIVSIN